MKHLYRVLLFSFLFSLHFAALPQSFIGDWRCDYATWDEQPNSTGYNTQSVAVIKPNHFVALVRRGSNTTSYLVGYKNADSANGRMGYYNYAPAGYRQPWVSGFDVVEMREAAGLAAAPDSLIYVANNDIDHNILVFKMSADSVISTDYRLLTGVDSLFAIDVDGQGRCYVTHHKAANTPGKVLIFKGIKQEPEWAGSHVSAPLQTITVPEAGELRGITVNSAGTVIYVSNNTTKKVYCYTGNPTTGYTLNNGFAYQLRDTIIATAGDTLRPGPWGLNYLSNKNILAISCAVSYKTGSGYEYSRVYFVNPNTGAVLDTIDAAKWNFQQTGGYNLRSGGTQGNASGYASLYGCDFDNQDKVYTVSYYGWTVDKWSFSGTLPTIPLTIVGIEKDPLANPVAFEMSQNFPNPFNPSTAIKFSLTEDAAVSLSVYDVTGKLVTTLINNAPYQKGAYTVTFDAAKLASGTYVYTLTAGNRSVSKKMSLLK